jgi:hypothetical protein
MEDYYKLCTIAELECGIGTAALEGRREETSTTTLYEEQKKSDFNLTLDQRAFASRLLLLWTISNEGMMKSSLILDKEFCSRNFVLSSNYTQL